MWQPRKYPIIDELNSVRYNQLNEYNRVFLPVTFRAALNLRFGDFYALTLSQEQNTIIVRTDNEKPENSKDHIVNNAGEIWIPKLLTDTLGWTTGDYLRLEADLNDVVAPQIYQKIIISKKAPGCITCGREAFPFTHGPLICDDCERKVAEEIQAYCKKRP